MSTVHLTAARAPMQSPLFYLQRFWFRTFPPKSNLEWHAERELSRLMGGPDGDEMQAAINKHLLRMVRAFAREGHSGFSASYAVAILEKLLRYEPLGPLTGDDAEWNDIGDMSSEPCWQNNRCSHVFKGADGRAYDINGRVFTEAGGGAFTGRGSRVYVTFPYTPKTEYVPVDDDGEPLEGPSREELADEPRSGSATPNGQASPGIASNTENPS